MVEDLHIEQVCALRVGVEPNDAVAEVVVKKIYNRSAKVRVIRVVKEFASGETLGKFKATGANMCVSLKNLFKLVEV